MKTQKTKIFKMKKILTFLFLAVAAITAQAQDNPNRLIIQPKAGSTKGYLVERIDSIYFTKVEGRVAADIDFKGYFPGEDGADTLKLAITRTPECVAYRIVCIPQVLANAFTSDAQMESYMETRGGQLYYDDFTNAEMTGFDFTFEPNTSYSLITYGYDKYGIGCSSSRVDFTTPGVATVGTPSVDYEVRNVDYTSFSVYITPNADCAGYYVCVFDKGQGQAQFEQWGPMFGFANIGDMIKQFSGKERSAAEEITWTGMTPGTEYEVYVQPVDVNDVYGEMVYVPVTTLAMGGEGVAECTITIGDYVTTSTGSYQEITVTPNDQTSFFRDMIIQKDVFTSSADWGYGNEDAIIEYLNQDMPDNPYWNLYGVDAGKWELAASTDYIVFARAQNIKGEWGPLARQDFSTPATGVSKVQGQPKRLNAKPAVSFTSGKVPALNGKRVKKQGGVSLVSAK